MASRNKTAFLVIHGVGPHTHFEACDSFIQGFYTEYAKGRGSSALNLEHKLKLRQNWLGNDIRWIQNYVSLVDSDDNITIDFYEYFWDIYMTHKASFRETYQMLIRASKGGTEFYKRHPDKVPDATDLGQFFRTKKMKDGKLEFKPAGYLKLLGPTFKFLSFILPYFPKLLWLLDKWAGTKVPVLGSLFEGFSALMKEPVPYFAGDLVNYLDLDPRSKNFETRQKITNGAIEELYNLINTDSYDQVVVIAHSLGSVIGYNAINRIIQDLNAGVGSIENASKIKGFVTFGSPLDKVALFFRTYIDDNKGIQRQVLNHLHGFRSLSLKREEPFGSEIPQYEIENPIKTQLNSLRWFNFYHQKDLISGRLDLYNLSNQNFQNLPELNGEGNIQIIDKGNKIKISTAHGCYWGDHQGVGRGTPQMQQVIIKEFIESLKD